MNRTFSTLLASALAVLPPGVAAAQSTPSHNRSIRAQDIIVRLSEEPGLYTIAVTPRIGDRIPGISDLSMLLAVRVDGVLIEERFLAATVAGSTQDGCGGSCSTCERFKSCITHSHPGSNYCSCDSSSFAAFGGAALAEGALIEVSLRAAPGSLSEVETSDDAAPSIFHPADAFCVTDFDDGTLSLHPDGGVTIDDLLSFFWLFADGRIESDVNADGGVTIDDLLYYLQRFEAGC